MVVSDTIRGIYRMVRVLSICGLATVKSFTNWPATGKSAEDEFNIAVN